MKTSRPASTRRSFLRAATAALLLVTSLVNAGAAVSTQSLGTGTWNEMAVTEIVAGQNGTSIKYFVKLHMNKVLANKDAYEDFQKALLGSGGTDLGTAIEKLNTTDPTSLKAVADAYRNQNGTPTWTIRLYQDANNHPTPKNPTYIFEIEFVKEIKDQNAFSRIEAYLKDHNSTAGGDKDLRALFGQDAAAKLVLGL
jgi:hypothetical protein